MARKAPRGRIRAPQLQDTRDPLRHRAAEHAVRLGMLIFDHPGAVLVLLDAAVEAWLHAAVAGAGGTRTCADVLGGNRGWRLCPRRIGKIRYREQQGPYHDSTQKQSFSHRLPDNVPWFHARGMAPYIPISRKNQPDPAMAGITRLSGCSA
jgi:hypothetical protein